MTTAERDLTFDECEAMRDELLAAMDGCGQLRFEHALIRAGWQARAGERVPREPTPEMIADAYGVAFTDPDSADDFYTQIWQAMYDAAPIAQPAEPALMALLRALYNGPQEGNADYEGAKLDVGRLLRAADAAPAEPVAQPVGVTPPSAIADRLRGIAEHMHGDAPLNCPCHKCADADTLYEAVRLLRPVAQPVAWLYRNEKRSLIEKGVCLVYAEKQRFSILPHEEGEPLYSVDRHD